LAAQGALASDASAADIKAAGEKLTASKAAKTEAWNAWKAATGEVAKKNMGLIIFGCVAGVAVVGAAVWYFACRDKNEGGEGGEAEARSLFKAQIKKNKTTTKETLVWVDENREIFNKRSNEILKDTIYFKIKP